MATRIAWRCTTSIGTAPRGSQRVDILDASSGSVLDSRSVTSFNGGQYLVWTLSGHVTIRITMTAASNAVLSGIFFN